MTAETPDLEELERLVSRASPGQWLNAHRQAEPCELTNFCHVAPGADAVALAYVAVSSDADYIAAFNPLVTSWLIERARRAEELERAPVELVECPGQPFEVRWRGFCLWETSNRNLALHYAQAFEAALQDSRS